VLPPYREDVGAVAVQTALDMGIMDLAVSEDMREHAMSMCMDLEDPARVPLPPPQPEGLPFDAALLSVRARAHFPIQFAVTNSLISGLRVRHLGQYERTLVSSDRGSAPGAPCDSASGKTAAGAAPGKSASVERSDAPEDTPVRRGAVDDGVSLEFNIPGGRGLRSIYSIDHGPVVPGAPSGEPAVTQLTATLTCAVDYMLAEPSLQPLRRLELPLYPDLRRLVRLGGLPQPRCGFGSDHFCLAADFVLGEQGGHGPH